MKRLPYIIILLLVLCALSCTRTSRHPQLVAVDSLLLERPDSALQVLLSLKGEVGGMGRQEPLPYRGRLGGGLNFSSKADRMYYYLLLADACNKCYDTLPSDSILREVADFYDSHGTPNEQVRAHYLLGCAYRDMGEAPQALDCYHDAIDRADTTAADCDYHTLSRVHSQSAALLGEQMLPYQQLEELHLQYVTAMKAKDTLCALNAMGQMANSHEMLGNYDSVIVICEQIISSYNKLKMPQKAASYYGNKAISLIDLSRYEEAKTCLDIYKLQSGFFNTEGDIEKNREIYYGVIGRYYMGIDLVDSAEFYFHKELYCTYDINNREYANRGLYMLYQKTGQRDSMSKYAQLAYQATDAHFQEKQSDELRHMQSLYNYSRSQTIAHQKTIEANRNKTTAVILAIILIFVLFTTWYILSSYRRRKQSQLREQQMLYEHDMEKMEQALYDLQQMQEKEKQQLIEEKLVYIEQLQKKLETFQHQSDDLNPDRLEADIIVMPIYQHFRYLLHHPREKATNSDWKELSSMIDEKLPSFRTTLYGNCASMKKSDYQICMLVRLHFLPSEIAVLTTTSNPYISLRRFRLLQKLFQRKGKAEEFDKEIRKIK